MKKFYRVNEKVAANERLGIVSAGLPPVIMPDTHFSYFLDPAGTEFYAELGTAEFKEGLRIQLPPLAGVAALPINGYIQVEVLLWGSGETLFYGGFYQDGLIELEPILVPVSILLPVYGSTVMVRYKVYNEAEQWVATSAFVHCELAPETFSIRIPGAINERVPYELAAQGVALTIPAYESMAAQDRLTIYLLGNPNAGGAVKRVELAETGVGHDIAIELSAAVLLANSNTSITVFYTVEKPGHTLMGPIASYWIEAGAGELEVAGGVALEFLPIRPEGKRPPYKFTMSASPWLHVGDGQGIVAWERFPDSDSRRNYRIFSQVASEVNGYSVEVVPDYDASRFQTIAWLEKGEGVLYASPWRPFFNPPPSEEQRHASAFVSQRRFELSAPTLLEAEDGMVSESAIAAGLTAQATLPPGLPVGTPAALQIRGYSSLTRYIIIYTAGNETVEWGIPSEVASVFRNQQVSLTYEFYDGSGDRSDSAQFMFAITHKPALILEAQNQSEGEAVLLLDAVQEGITLSLVMTAQHQPGDVVTFYYGGTAGLGHWVGSIVLEQRHFTEGVKVSLGPEYVLPHAGGHVVLAYSVLSLGREVDGLVSRYRVQAIVEPVLVSPAINDYLVITATQDPTYITVPPYPGMALGDRLVFFSEQSYGAPFGVIYSRQELVITQVGQAIQFPVLEVAESYLGFEIRLFVIRADQAGVTFWSGLFKKGVFASSAAQRPVHLLR